MILLLKLKMCFYIPSFGMLVWLSHSKELSNVTLYTVQVVPCRTVLSMLMDNIPQGFEVLLVMGSWLCLRGGGERDLSTGSVVLCFVCIQTLPASYVRLKK